MAKVLQNMPLSKFLFAQMYSGVSDKEITGGLTNDLSPICTFTTITDTTYRVITFGVKKSYKNYEKPTTYLIPDGYSPIVRIFNPINIMITADSDGLGFVNYHIMSNGNISLTEIVPTSKYLSYSAKCTEWNNLDTKPNTYYYSVDNGTNWVSITSTGVFLTKGRQIKFRAVAGSEPARKARIVCPELNITLIAEQGSSQGADVQSDNYTLTQNITVQCYYGQIGD